MVSSRADLTISIFSTLQSDRRSDPIIIVPHIIFRIPRVEFPHITRIPTHHLCTHNDELTAMVRVV